MKISPPSGPAEGPASACKSDCKSSGSSDPSCKSSPRKTVAVELLDGSVETLGPALSCTVTCCVTDATFIFTLRDCGPASACKSDCKSSGSSESACKSSPRKTVAVELLDGSVETLGPPVSCTVTCCVTDATFIFTLRDCAPDCRTILAGCACVRSGADTRTV